MILQLFSTVKNKLKKKKKKNDSASAYLLSRGWFAVDGSG
jgi:hypothetical protein